MDSDLLTEVEKNLNLLVNQANQPFFKQLQFWSVVLTFLAVIVALLTPWIIHWLERRPKKSNIIALGVNVADQSNNTYEVREENTLYVGRLIIKNKGNHLAKSAEVYLEKVFDQEIERKNFFPIPLRWTHGQLRESPTVRDIYPNQVAYLDIFNYYFEPNFVGNRLAKFVVGAGWNYDDLTLISTGESRILLKLYQESGQVESFSLKINWTNEVPSINIL